MINALAALKTQHGNIGVMISNGSERYDLVDIIECSTLHDAITETEFIAITLKSGG